jgi:hypothetical protein
LTGNFLRGLIATGVPEGILYAPTRYIANNDKERATAADALADWLWLPTEWEVFGESLVSERNIWETAANQVRLEYYEGPTQWLKRTADYRLWWWTASPDSGSVFDFCYVGVIDTLGIGASAVGGCAPAFCVR